MGMEARLHQVTVALSAEQLANLFYHHQNLFLEALNEEGLQDKETVYDALVKDAQAFAQELGVTPTDYPDFAQDLAADFQRRAAL